MDAKKPSDEKANQLIITRIIDAPPQRVFEAWLSPDLLAQWIGPRGVGGEAQILEPRVGGRYRIKMHTPDGLNPIVSGVYREIVAPSRLVFTWIWEHEFQETLVTLTVAPSGNGTQMTLRHEGFANADRRDSHNNGWSSSFDKLAELLAVPAARS